MLHLQPQWAVAGCWSHWRCRARFWHPQGWVRRLVVGTQWQCPVPATLGRFHLLLHPRPGWKSEFKNLFSPLILKLCKLSPLNHFFANIAFLLVLPAKPEPVGPQGVGDYSTRAVGIWNPRPAVHFWAVWSLCVDVWAYGRCCQPGTRFLGQTHCFFLYWPNNAHSKLSYFHFFKFEFWKSIFSV